MKAYHRTFHSREILTHGFRDTTGRYFTTEEFTGVFFSDRPLDMNEGADGDVLLEMELPDEIFVQYELVEEEKPYRAALIPAELANSFGPPRTVSPDEEDRLLS